MHFIIFKTFAFLSSCFLKHDVYTFQFILQVFWLTDWKYKYYIDPALSVLLVLLILHSVWPLLRDSALILLQTVPTHIQVDAIQRRLLAKVDGVLAVHEFHVWQLAGDRIIASAHIR